MNNLHYAYISSDQDKIDNLPIRIIEKYIHVYRRKQPNKKRYLYRLILPYNDNREVYSPIGADEMKKHIDNFIGEYSANHWISSDDSHQIRYQISIVKHYE